MRPSYNFEFGYDDEDYDDNNSDENYDEDEDSNSDGNMAAPFVPPNMAVPVCRQCPGFDGGCASLYSSQKECFIAVCRSEIFL